MGVMVQNKVARFFHGPCTA